MSLPFLAASSWIIVAFVMGIAWFVARRLDNYSIVDAVWALSFACLAPLVVVFSPGWAPRKLAIGALFLVWSVRLGSYLAVRIFGHLETEDGRYQRLRDEYGARVASRFFLFFQMQALSVAILLLPLFLAARNPIELVHPLEVLGALLFVIGFLGESVADAQLNRFKRDQANRGRVCEVGLWRYSRLPNYFFEAVIWLGFGTLAAGSPDGAWAFLASGAMWFLLLKVTGVPFSEEQNLRSKPEAYRDYQKRVNRFVPGPRRRNPN